MTPEAVARHHAARCHHAADKVHQHNEERDVICARRVQELVLEEMKVTMHKIRKENGRIAKNEHNTEEEMDESDSEMETNQGQEESEQPDTERESQQPQLRNTKPTDHDEETKRRRQKQVERSDVPPQTTEEHQHRYQTGGTASTLNECSNMKLLRVAIDGFCGSGGNAIQLAKAFDLVYAIDLDPRKIADAKENAKLYGVEHKILFICDDIYKMLGILKVSDKVTLSYVGYHFTMIILNTRRFLMLF